MSVPQSRYPRSFSRSQSANSSQKAKRPSSEKRKTSSSSSYSKSEQPFFMKYISTSYKISSQRLPWPLVRERSVGLWDSMSITVSVAWRRWTGICQAAIFGVAEWPYCEWKRITSARPVVRWVLKRRPNTERSSVSEGDALRRAREEIAQLEAERVRLSTDVMEGRPGALEEEERLRQRIAELGHWLSEAEKEGGTDKGGGAA